MPELPEVHTTVSQLKQEVVGKTIADVWSDYHEASTPKEGQLKDPNYYGGFVSAVTGAMIKGAERRGKNILLHLDNGHTILIHMKMTGHLLFGEYRQKGNSKSEIRNAKQAHKSKIVNHKSGEKIDIPDKWHGEHWVPLDDKDSALWDPFNRFIHLVFTFEDNTNLVLSDMRKFGKITLLDSEQLKGADEIASLGPNPYELTSKQFRETIRDRRSGQIKEVLMDQSVIAGVGNIYSDEALWKAQIHPETDIHDLSNTQLNELLKALKDVMNRAIETGGDSDSDYRDLYGQKGQYQEFHNAYRRSSKPCPRSGCSGIIERIKIGGRSAHYCPVCQQKTVS